MCMYMHVCVCICIYMYIYCIGQNVHWCSSVWCYGKTQQIFWPNLHKFLKLMNDSLVTVYAYLAVFRNLVIGSEKTMATHSSTLAWKIPWTEEPGRLQSMGSLRVRHDWATSLSLFTFMHWRRKWQPTPVFLSEESQGRRSLVGCRLWGCTESDMTEAT